MRRAFSLAGLLLLGVTLSCSLLLDTGSLQGSGKSSGAGGAATSGAGGSAGTGGGIDDAGDGPAGIPLNGLSTALAHAVCENLKACYVSALEIVIHDEDCESFFTSVITGQIVAPIQESVLRGLVGYNPRDAAACVANLVAATQMMPPACAEFNKVVEDCKSMLTKLAPAGRACRNRFECAAGLTCDSATNCPGTCKPFAATGAMCLVDGDCNPLEGLYCQKVADAGEGAPGTCQTFVPINGDCVDRDQCVPGALCIEKKCRRLSDLFTAAETFTCYTSGSLCQRGLDCEFMGLPLLSQGTCVKEKNPLDPCKLALPDECPKNTYCSANGFNAGGQCLATPVENQPCGTDFEQSVGIAAPCKAGLTCVKGICKPMRQLGQPCETNAQCYSSACQGPDGGVGMCVPLGCP
jgi:Dickkopf N-terminal cysteine-rich region